MISKVVMLCLLTMWTSNSVSNACWLQIEYTCITLYMYMQNYSWFWAISSIRSNNWKEEDIDWYPPLDGSRSDSLQPGPYYHLRLQGKYISVQGRCNSLVARSLSAFFTCKKKRDRVWHLKKKKCKMALCKLRPKALISNLFASLIDKNVYLCGLLIIRVIVPSLIICV